MSVRTGEWSFHFIFPHIIWWRWKWKTKSWGHTSIKGGLTTPRWHWCWSAWSRWWVNHNFLKLHFSHLQNQHQLMNVIFIGRDCDCVELSLEPCSQACCESVRRKTPTNFIFLTVFTGEFYLSTYIPTAQCPNRHSPPSSLVNMICRILEFELNNQNINIILKLEVLHE